MSPDNLELKPQNIVGVGASNSKTRFTIQLTNMTWCAELLIQNGQIYGVIQDEYGVPLDDGHQILGWLLSRPEFILRMLELARKNGVESSLGNYS